MKLAVRLLLGIQLGLMCSFCSAQNSEVKTTTNQQEVVLHYLVQEPRVAGKTKKAIVLLHGLGSNEDDLFSLRDQLPKDCYIIAPRGKFTLSKGSYAWYHVDFSSGKPVYNPNEELQSRKAILQFLEKIKVKYGLDDIYLGGFSQGAIMSSTIGLLYPEKVKGIFCLSGRLLDEIKPSITPSPALQRMKVFMVHGTQDGMLGITNAREAKTYLEQLNVKVRYIEYPMGHQVIQKELDQLNLWFGEE